MFVDESSILRNQSTRISFSSACSFQVDSFQQLLPYSHIYKYQNLTTTKKYDTKKNRRIKKNDKKITKATTLEDT